MQVEVFADVWCPFTHVGLRRFVERRARAGKAVDLRVRAWPLERVNGRPLDPAFVAEEVEQIRATVAPELFVGFDIGNFPATTIPALQLTCRAYETSMATGEAVALELRDRLFERGEDVSDPAILAAVATAHGLEPEGPADDLPGQDWQEGQRRGVIGSPHFFTPGGSFFCPALDVRKVDGHLLITADPEGFDRFVRSCLASS
jgi:predicted DsbA family dithiol-disulfide isomerase